MKIRNQVYLGDCLFLLKKVPDESISFVITDPPYNYEFIGKDWNTSETNRRINKIRQSKTLVKNIPYGSGLSGGVRNAKWYQRNRDNIFEYGKWCEQWGKELFRVTKSGSLVFIFNSSRTIAHVQIAMENCGFYTRDILIWRRNSGIPKGINISKKLEKLGNSDYKKWEGWHSCLRNEYEAILVTQKPLINNYIETLEKNGLGLFKAKHKEYFQSNIIENISNKFNKDFDNTHCTVKPLDLIKKLIKLVCPKGSNHIIFDPFLGSGTTAVACKELGLDYLGFEKEKEYFEIIKTRLKESHDEATN